MTPNAVLAAIYRIADGHYHAWSEFCTEAEWSTEHKDTCARVLAAMDVAEAETGDSVGQRPSLHHRTETGRLEWCVTPDGNGITITVYRPAGILRLEESEYTVILAELRYGETGWTLTGRADARPTLGAHWRHVRALAGVVFPAVHGRLRPRDAEILDSLQSDGPADLGRLEWVVRHEGLRPSRESYGTPTDRESVAERLWNESAALATEQHIYNL